MSQKRRKKGNGGIILLFLILLAIGDLFDGSEEKNDSDYSNKIIEKESEYKQSYNFYSEEENEISEKSFKIKDDISKNDKLHAPKKPNKYVKDDILNQLMEDYDEIAEFKLEQWRIGAYPSNVIMSCNEVYIMAYNSNSIFVDLSIEDLDDSRIYPVFRDFMKTLDSTVTDDEISSGWNELLTGKYIGYKYYNIGNIECSCSTRSMSNGTISYIVKTGCETYK